MESIVIASGKGGTGKSTIAVNLGAALATMGYKVVLVDMDMGQRDLDMYMGLQNNVVYDIADLARGDCRVRQAMIKDRRFKTLYLIAASPDTDAGLTTENIKGVIDRLRSKFDYVIMDAPAGLGRGVILAASAADKAIMVTEPNNSSIRDADRLDAMLEEMGIEKRYFIINKVNMELINARGCMSFEEIATYLKSKVLGIVQYDETVVVAVNKGIPAVLSRKAYIGDNFRNIARRIISK